MGLLLAGAAVVTIVILLIFRPPAAPTTVVKNGSRLTVALSNAIPAEPGAKKAVAIIIADPTCAHCHTLIQEFVDAWTPAFESRSRLGVVYVGHMPGISKTDQPQVVLPSHAFTLVDSTRELLTDLTIRYYPVTLLVDTTGTVIGSLVGAVAPDSVRKLLQFLQAGN